jgi:2-hydroxychromene-2-carboxylate isomerase
MAAGQDPDRVLAAARSQDTIDAYGRATDEARLLGVFGSPTFVVDGEVFWGDDRLEDAIAWRKARP